MPTENISYRFTRFREQRSMDKEQLGQSLGVTGRYIDMIEKGAKDVDPNSSLYKLFCLMESNRVPTNLEIHHHRGSKLKEDAAEYRTKPRPANGAGLSEEDALSQVRADIEIIESGTAAEKRRALIFLRDHHLPLLARILHIDC